jgi:hypothetical protein
VPNEAGGDSARSSSPGPGRPRADAEPSSFNGGETTGRDGRGQARELRAASVPIACRQARYSICRRKNTP